ncbi:MAG: phosphatidate cytidylyltransferase [Gammaproteobacteria bacterium]|nr:phosphatidate cytidylyltransferase [Gammaproteobacteria bacterium]MDH5660434.1 phosphatidate cytidylyltransferase [Gammaproteobacteria bacterium]
MLKNRLLTAFLMGPLILWGVYALPENFFALFAFVLVSVGAWEWSAIAGLIKPIQRGLFIVVNVLLFSAVIFFQNNDINIVIIVASLLWWIICVPLLLSFPFEKNNIVNTKMVKILVGPILLLGTLVSMMIIRSNPAYGPEYVLYLILLIWFADSGAYFAGRTLGKNKLIPNVSPGKTWEGVAGALAVTFIVALVSINLLNIPSTHTLMFMLITLVTVIYSIVGDLSESMFKRMANIKDSGHIIPGHGGVLDRIDSLMSGFPVFFAGLWLMEKLV